MITSAKDGHHDLLQIQDAASYQHGDEDEHAQPQPVEIGSPSMVRSSFPVSEPIWSYSDSGSAATTTFYGRAGAERNAFRYVIRSVFHVLLLTICSQFVRVCFCTTSDTDDSDIESKKALPSRKVDARLGRGSYRVHKGAFGHGFGHYASQRPTKCMSCVIFLNHLL